MRLRAGTAFSLFALLARASAALYTGPFAQAGWNAEARPAPTDVVALTLALRVPRRAALRARLEEVSDPRSARYGAYLGAEALRAAAGPAARDAAAVRGWLGERATVARASLDGSLLHVSATVADAEALLGTELRWHAPDAAADEAAAAAADDGADDEPEYNVERVVGKRTRKVKGKEVTEYDGTRLGRGASHAPTEP